MEAGADDRFSFRELAGLPEVDGIMLAVLARLGDIPVDDVIAHGAGDVVKTAFPEERMAGAENFLPAKLAFASFFVGLEA